MISSPYSGLAIEMWQAKTLELIAEHPLQPEELYDVVLKVWADIFRSGIGSKPFRIGVDLFPVPQIMGFFLHELIPLELEYRYPKQWRRNMTADEKDLIYLPNDSFSIEIKTSSSRRNIYGNRSYAQLGKVKKKNKSGYYLAINFQKFTPRQHEPQITQVRFGWLGQVSETGHQARLSPLVERYKLLTLPIQE